MNEALPTLLFPFVRGMFDAPGAGERVLFLGAPAGLRLPAGFEADFLLVQDFRPDYLALEKAGFSVVPRAEGDGFDAAFVLFGRHRRENESRLAEALRRVRPGGPIVAAGTKRDGAQSLARRIGELLPVEDRLSKHHGVVFRMLRPEMLSDDIPAALAAPARTTSEGYETAAGGFSEGTVDPGSRLLADSLPPDVRGEAADFAAGWGYLSLRLAEKFPLAALDLYEAHCPSLAAARRNLASRAPHAKCSFLWHDLASEPVERRYDVIVMNPPFHRGRAAEPDIGRRIIEVAANALNDGGRLFLVANRGLPYEPVMEAVFSQHGEIRRDETYKVLWGRK